MATGQDIGKEAAFFLNAAPEELQKLLDASSKALEALQRYDGGLETDAAAVQALLDGVLKEHLDCTDMVDRQKALAELLHLRRMSERTLSIRQVQHNKTFRQQATRVLYGPKPEPVGNWASLFGGKK